MCENLTKLGIDVTVLEKLPHVTPALDEDIAVYVEDYLAEKGIAVETDVTVQENPQRSRRFS